MQRRARRLVVFNVVVACALLWAARETDTLSCQRQQEPRHALVDFLRSDAEFQRALSVFDSTADRTRHRVTLFGQPRDLTRAGVRDWIAERWLHDGVNVKAPACRGIFPTAT